MKHSEYKTLTGWVDKDRPRLHKLTYIQKRWYFFSKRIPIVLTKPLDNIYRTVLRNPKHSPILIFGTSICCAIEALGKYQTGGDKKKHENFYSFMSYLNRDYKKKTVDTLRYEEVLWKYLRNGLAHGLAICHGGFEHQNKYFSIKKINKRDCLMIDPKHFYNDFKLAINKYKKELSASNPSVDQKAKDFEKVFNDVLILGN